MNQHYLFFTRNQLPQPRADLIQIISCANAAANLGYGAVLSYLTEPKTFAPIRYLRPFRPQAPDLALQQFYNLQDRLQVAALPIPAIAKRSQKWMHPSTIVSKYYFPVHLRPVTQLVHTRDWNFVKAAIKGGVAAIYEHDHYAEQQFEPEIVHHPLFQITVTVAEPIRQSLIQHGMPAEKIILMHNGFNQQFLVRHPEQAQIWRDRLLAENHDRLAVYSGALYSFKGVDLLLDVAAKMPDVQFAFAGGKPEQVTAYEQLCRDRLLGNVTFLGHLPHEQLASLLQAADVLVHPHCAGEAATFTSPMKFFDYMAAGTPIVATEILPLMEFKPSGVVAGWCEPDRSAQLEACMRQVFQTHPRRAEGYSRSMQFVHQFSWENRIATLLNRVDDTLRPQLI